MMIKPKNLPESVKQRLKNLATKSGEDFNALCQYYVMERFLYRVSKSPNSHFYILKGALMLRVLGGSLSRATQDIDFQMQSPSDAGSIIETIRECLHEGEAEDGVRFDPNSLHSTPIQFDARDRGVRVDLLGYIGTARFKIQVDVGSGGQIIPKPTWIQYPTLLDFSSPRLLGYPKESIVADKFEAMVSRDLTNSRVKDFYDIWILSESESFHEDTLSDALQSTFSYYKTDIPRQKPVCLTAAFLEIPAQERRWNAFLKNAQIKLDLSLEQALQRVELFLIPVCEAIQDASKQNRLWQPSGPWQSRG